MATTTTVTMIERMYWEHGYSEEQIANRLRADPRVVSRIVSKDYVEIQHWDEDNNRYTVERQQRERKTPLRTEGETMIFPDLPKRIDCTRADSIEAASAYTVETPLRRSSIDSTLDTVSNSITAGDPAVSFAEYFEAGLVFTGILLWIIFFANLHYQGIM